VYTHVEKQYWYTGTSARGQLVAALSDEDPVVAEAAAWGLGRMKADR
jgi:hypothetical protein